MILANKRCETFKTDLCCQENSDPVLQVNQELFCGLDFVYLHISLGIAMPCQDSIRATHKKIRQIVLTVRLFFLNAFTAHKNSKRITHCPKDILPQTGFDRPSESFFLPTSLSIITLIMSGSCIQSSTPVRYRCRAEMRVRCCVTLSRESDAMQLSKGL